jgi:hypothetical protein
VCVVGRSITITGKTVLLGLNPAKPDAFSFFAINEQNWRLNSERVTRHPGQTLDEMLTFLVWPRWDPSNSIRQENEHIAAVWPIDVVAEPIHEELVPKISIPSNDRLAFCESLSRPDHHLFL